MLSAMAYFGDKVSRAVEKAGVWHGGCVTVACLKNEGDFLRQRRGVSQLLILIAVAHQGYRMRICRPKLVGRGLHNWALKMSAEENQIVHLVLRVPLITRVQGRPINTIEAHNEIIEKMGRVSLAKFGQAGTRARSEKLKAQIERGVETLLILVVKQGARHLGYQSPLASIHYGKPDNQILSVAPPYYATLGPAGLWFIVTSPFVTSNLDDFRLATNRRPVANVVSECRTSAMLVERAQ
jgi:hypothetical protein